MASNLRRLFNTVQCHSLFTYEVLSTSSSFPNTESLMNITPLATETSTRAFEWPQKERKWNTINKNYQKSYQRKKLSNKVRTPEMEVVEPSSQGDSSHTHKTDPFTIGKFTGQVVFLCLGWTHQPLSREKMIVQEAIVWQGSDHGKLLNDLEALRVDAKVVLAHDFLFGSTRYFLSPQSWTVSEARTTYLANIIKEAGTVGPLACVHRWRTPNDWFCLVFY